MTDDDCNDDGDDDDDDDDERLPSLAGAACHPGLRQVHIEYVCCSPLLFVMSQSLANFNKMKLTPRVSNDVNLEGVVVVDGAT